MPAKQAHLDQINRNRALLGDCLDPATSNHLDWAVTVAFYTAIHYVEALLDSKIGYHSPDHKGREGVMSRVKEFRPIATDYYELKRYSHESRYLCKAYTREQVLKNIIPHLEKIEKTLKLLL